MTDANAESGLRCLVHHPKPNQELLIPAGAVHSARNIGSTTAHWLYGYLSDS